MIRYKVDENTIREDTGRIKIHNYPAKSKHTYSYITRIYREYKCDEPGYIEVDGQPIYFHNLPPDTLAFAKIMAEAETALNAMLPKEQFYDEIK